MNILKHFIINAMVQKEKIPYQVVSDSQTHKFLQNIFNIRLSRQGLQIDKYSVPKYSDNFI